MSCKTEKVTESVYEHIGPDYSQCLYKNSYIHYLSAKEVKLVNGDNATMLEIDIKFMA